MSKAFTLIELVFIILIIGIVYAIAAPAIMSTRDDAEITKAVVNLKDIISDLNRYYVSQSGFGKNIASMTNVMVKENQPDIDLSEASLDHPLRDKIDLYVKDKRCLTITLSTEKEDDYQKIPAYLDITDGADAGAEICRKLAKNKSIIDLRSATFTASIKKSPRDRISPYSLDSDNKDEEDEWQNDLVITGIPISNRGVSYSY